MLDSVGDRNAQWHFLKGAVCWRKGWLDEARRHYEAAAAMEPGDPEYCRAVERMENGPRYRREALRHPACGESLLRPDRPGSVSAAAPGPSAEGPGLLPVRGGNAPLRRP